MTSYLHIIILYMIKKFQGERSIYAIYHMLQGKKSSQTIQDAHIFGLKNMFGIIPNFTRSQLDSIIQTLVINHWIHAHEKPEIFIITPKGENQLDIHAPIPSQLNGWKYKNISQVFWGRLNLFIQTLSHMIHKEARFYPIERNPKIQQSIKQFLQKNKQNRELMAAQLYEELVDILEGKQALHREIFVRKLTGSNRIGATFEQIAKLMELDEWYVRILFIECLHEMVEDIESTSGQYRLLSALISDLQHTHLTRSTQLTLQYIKEGRTLIEISNIRQLKINTIEDHVVELVLANRQFPIDDFVPVAVQNKIIKAITNLQTKQLKVIKQWLADDEISFFQIRLMLAKVGG